MTQFLNEKEVAEMLKISTRTLQNDRFLGMGIPYLKIGGAVRYRLTDIEEWLSQRTVKPALERRL